MTIPRLKPQIAAYSAAVQHPKGEGYNIKVDDLWFRTVASRDVPIVIATRDSLAQRSDDTGSIYNNVLDIGYAWSRTDVSGGEGLDWSPRILAIESGQEALDELRFWDSTNINVERPPRGEKYAMRLARTTAAWGATFSNPLDMAVSDDYIWVADGDTIEWYTGWGTSTATSSYTPVAATNVIALAASPYSTVMAVLANGDVWGLRSYPTETSFSKIYDATLGANDNATGVWYANGRFFISTFDSTAGGTLRALEWDGTDYDPPVDVDTAPAAFVSVVESGPAVVAACTDGTVRSYSPDTGQPGLPLLPRARTTMPKSEQPILLGSNAGVLLILTTSDTETANRQNLRMYSAEVLDSRFDYVVGGLQLKREWYAETHVASSTRNIASTRDEMFWFIREDQDGTLYECLWRYDVVTGGMSRLLAKTGIDYQSTVVFDSIVGAIDIVGGGVDIQSSTNYETEGWMIFPNITFGLNTDISWLAVTIEAQNLVLSGGTVELWGSTDPDAIGDRNDVSWQLLQRLTATDPEEKVTQLSGIKSRTLALQLRVTTTSSTYTPTISRIGLRGIPSQRDIIMVVPFNVSDYVSVPGRSPMHVPGLGNALHSTVLDLVGQAVDATVLEPPIEFRGIVNNVSEPVIYQSPRGSLVTYVNVEFRGEKVETPSTGALVPQQDGFAIGTAGVTLAGVSDDIA